MITEDLSEYIAIALLAVHEKAKGKDSFWSSYIGVLPTVEEVRGESKGRQGKGREGKGWDGSVKQGYAYPKPVRAHWQGFALLFECRK